MNSVLQSQRPKNEKIELDWLGNPDWYNDVFLDLFYDDSRTKILYGSRDTGKSHFIAQYLIHKCLNEPYFKYILARKYQNTIKESQWETIKSVVEEWELGKYFQFVKSPLEIRCVNGNRFIGRGLDEAKKLKSIKDPSGIWIEEADEITEDDFDTLRLGIRPPQGIKPEEIISFNSSTSSHWIPKKFFPGETNEYELPDGMHTYVEPKTKNTTIIHTCYKHNQFITDDRIEIIEEYKDNSPTKYKRHGLGLFVDEVDGALWTQKLVDNLRVSDYPDLHTLVVALDPSETSNKGVKGKRDSDEAGIIAAGAARDGHYYVLRDSSDILSPDAQSRRSIDLYNSLEADTLVYEKNAGGDWIPTVIKNIDKTVHTSEVWASRGKETRAQPTVTLYEEGLVHHVGYLPKLEDEMTSWVPGLSRSPNRIDALVWAITYLSNPKKKKKMGLLP